MGFVQVVNDKILVMQSRSQGLTKGHLPSR